MTADSILKLIEAARLGSSAKTPIPTGDDDKGAGQ